MGLFNKVLNEQLLNEASKRRFIEPIWGIISSTKNEETLMHYVDTEKSASDFPSAEEIIKWVDSGAADKYRIDWNVFTNIEQNAWVSEVKRLLKCYFDYLITKQAKKDPKSQFKDEKKFKILDENKDWLFIGLLNYEAAVYCDSFNCGGAGARWCIGYEKTDDYWFSYTEKDSMFILAYNKRNFGSEDNQKYMLQVKGYIDNPDAGAHKISVETWRQDDNPNSTLNTYETTQKFNINEEQLLNWYNEIRPLVINIEYVYTASLSELNNKVLYIQPNDSDLILLPDMNKVSISYCQVLSNLKSREQINSLVYDGEELTFERVVKYGQFRMIPANYEQEQEMFRHENRPTLCFRNMDEVHIDRLWVSQNEPRIIFQNCKKVQIDSLAIPQPFLLTTEDFSELIIKRDFEKLIEEEVISVTFDSCDNIEIGGAIILPNRSYSAMSSSNFNYGENKSETTYYLSIDDFGYNTTQPIPEKYLCVRINMFVTDFNDWEDVWSSFINEDKKEIIVDRLINPTSERPLKNVQLYNVFPGYKPVWEGGNVDGPKPEAFYAYPYIMKENTLIESTLFNRIIKEDYKYVARVGNLYLQGDDFTSDPDEAHWYETDEEPRQIINQLKKDRKGIFDSAKNRRKKIKIEKIKESYEEENKEIEDLILKLWPKLAKKSNVDERIADLEIKFEEIDGLDCNAAATTNMELKDKELNLSISIDPIIFCFKTELLVGVLCHEMAHAEIVCKLYNKYIKNEIDFNKFKEGCKQNQKHFEPWKKEAKMIAIKNNIDPKYSTITEIDFGDDDNYQEESD